MQKKLTIRLDAELIEWTKKYAERTNSSLSELVENFFYLLSTLEDDAESEMAPGVKRMAGVLEGSGVDIDDYKRYLVEKYL